MRILVLGGSGQLGWELTRALAPLGDVTALDRGGRGGLSGDLEDPDGLRLSLRSLEPELIVNAAAYTDVDRAESEPERAERINADAVAVLAAETDRLGACLVHYSSDYVFDGAGAAPWDEDANAAPLNVYGRTKLAGERAIRDSGCRHLLFRSQWVYGTRGDNFIAKILRAAMTETRMRVVADQSGAPTGAELIADVSTLCLHRVIEQRGPYGTFHVAARGETTWHGYARFVIDRARRAGWPVSIADDAVVAVTSEEWSAPAERPRNGRLSVERLERTFGLRMPEWQRGVARAVAEMSPGNVARTGEGEHGT